MTSNGSLFDVVFRGVDAVRSIGSTRPNDVLIGAEDVARDGVLGVPLRNHIQSCMSIAKIVPKK